MIIAWGLFIYTLCYVTIEFLMATTRSTLYLYSEYKKHWRVWNTIAELKVDKLAIFFHLAVALCSAQYIWG